MIINGLPPAYASKSFLDTVKKSSNCIFMD